MALVLFRNLGACGQFGIVVLIDFKEAKYMRIVCNHFRTQDLKQYQNMKEDVLKRHRIKTEQRKNPQ